MATIDRSHLLIIAPSLLEEQRDQLRADLTARLFRLTPTKAYICTAYDHADILGMMYIKGTLG